MEIKINDNVSISDANLKIKRFIGTIVVDRREIVGIQSAGNKFFGVINCLLIFNLPTGLKMLKGKKRILLKKKHEKNPIIFWLYPAELSKLRNTSKKVKNEYMYLVRCLHRK